MDQKEKEYIDKKFAEMQDNFFNPDPEKILQNSKVYQKFYKKFYLKWIIIGMIACILTMLISFYTLGLI